MYWNCMLQDYGYCIILIAHVIWIFLSPEEYAYVLDDETISNLLPEILVTNSSAQEGFLIMARGEADEPVHVASFYAPLSYLAHVLYMWIEIGITVFNLFWVDKKYSHSIKLIMFTCDVMIGGNWKNNSQYIKGFCCCYYMCKSKLLSVRYWTGSYTLHALFLTSSLRGKSFG